MNRQWISRPRRHVASLAMGSVVAGPAVAASSLGGIDWDSYFNWNAYADYTNWYSLVLMGSIALLVLALLVRAVKSAKSPEESVRVPTAKDRIGTMPIEPLQSVAWDGDERRPYRISSPVSTGG